MKKKKKSIFTWLAKINSTLLLINMELTSTNKKVEFNSTIVYNIQIDDAYSDLEKEFEYYEE